MVILLLRVNSFIETNGSSCKTWRARMSFHKDKVMSLVLQNILLAPATETHTHTHTYTTTTEVTKTGSWRRHYISAETWRWHNLIPLDSTHNPPTSTHTCKSLWCLFCRLICEHTLIEARPHCLVCSQSPCRFHMCASFSETNCLTIWVKTWGGIYIHVRITSKFR